jgi:hypothetical protein
MGEQRSSWYVRGKGNQPTGPFTAEELLQSVRAGQLDPNTICWREGMSQWIALLKVEPFVSAIASASVPAQATEGSARSFVPRAGVPSSPPNGSRQATPRRPPAAWLGWAIAGGLGLSICAVIAGVGLLSSGGSTGQSWGSSYSVDYATASPDGLNATLKISLLSRIRG